MCQWYGSADRHRHPDRTEGVGVHQVPLMDGRPVRLLSRPERSRDGDTIHMRLQQRRDRRDCANFGRVHAFVCFRRRA